jgi:hypothetical protein
MPEKTQQPFLERLEVDLFDEASAEGIHEIVDSLLTIVSKVNRDSLTTPGGGRQMRLRLSISVSEVWG